MEETIKALRSKGILIKYIDIATQKNISKKEYIFGNIGENYNISNLKKKIKDYTLVEMVGKSRGKFEKELIEVVVYYIQKG